MFILAVFLSIVLTSSPVLSQEAIGCYVPGECMGALYVDFDEVITPSECHQLCIDADGCEFWTHYADDPLCFPFS